MMKFVDEDYNKKIIKKDKSYKDFNESKKKKDKEMFDEVKKAKDLEKQDHYYISFQIRITDTGPGIAKEDMKKLFINFSKLADHDKVNN